MADGTTSGSDTSRGSDREDRLKAALKANLARRKAQARARAEQARPVSEEKPAKPARTRTRANGFDSGDRQR
ncbi:hypothetical protein [Sedimentitalea arenosa]|uniref:hypothetical protein n=1 Tax=Sedimentitalea arenosa TaxID=2798803 RepID=UPI001E644873|nr:hypothetical protein [Arenibacterium arenosum]